MSVKTVKMKMITTGTFTTPAGMSYSVLGVGEDGVVYRYDPKCEGWIPWSMKVVACGPEHKAGR